MIEEKSEWPVEGVGWNTRIQKHSCGSQAMLHPINFAVDEHQLKNFSSLTILKYRAAELYLWGVSGNSLGSLWEVSGRSLGGFWEVFAGFCLFYNGFLIVLHPKSLKVFGFFFVFGSFCNLKKE